MWLDQFDFFFFDFDGVLVNTELLHAQAYDETFATYGQSLDWDFPTYCKYAHHSTEALKNAVYTALPELKRLQSDWEVIREEKTRKYLELLKSNQLKLMPGVDQLLEYLKEVGKPSCVVTNSTIEQTNVIRELLPKLNLITNWLTRDDYQKPKPNPDGYLLGISKFASSNSRYVGFEDTVKGINSLLQTPIKPVLVNNLDHEGLDELPSSITRFDSFIDAMKEKL